MVRFNSRNKNKLSLKKNKNFSKKKENKKYGQKHLSKKKIGGFNKEKSNLKNTDNDDKSKTEQDVDSKPKEDEDIINTDDIKTNPVNKSIEDQSEFKVSDKSSDLDEEAYSDKYKLDKLIEIRKEVDDSIQSLYPDFKLDEILDKEKYSEGIYNILDNNEINISLKPSDKISITKDISNNYQGWKDLKKKIRSLPYNTDKDKYDWLNLIDLNNNKKMIELILFSKGVPNGIKLYFENLKFKSNPQNGEYFLQFINLILDDKKYKNHIFFPLPVTVPILYVKEIMTTNNLISSEDVIPQEQLNHVNKYLQKKKLDVDDFNKLFNKINFYLDSKKKCWFTNLVNIYESLGFFYNNDNKQDNFYCKIDPNALFWDNSIDINSDGQINSKYSKWINNQGEIIGLSNIQINIVDQYKEEEIML